MYQDCLICERIELIHRNENPDFVAELETCYVVIGWFQFFHGYTLVFSKKHQKELHELEENFKMQFLKEMSLVAEAVYKAFSPVKLNYELLGNTDPHLHWHLIPRHTDDPNIKGPAWRIEKSLTHGEGAKITKKQLDIMRPKLLSEIKKIATVQSDFLS